MSDLDTRPRYRIEYTIQRMAYGDEDFSDIGFGSSGGWLDVDAALYDVESTIQRREWETEGDMPDPDDVDNAESGNE